MGRPWPRIPIIAYAPRGAVMMFMLVVVLTILAGLFHLLVTDIDEFEARTGLFEWIGILVIDGILVLIVFFTGLWAVSVFFPRSWGPKAGIGGAILCALVCAFFVRVLWLGGAGD